ncbi:UNVERIFIED_CONTAM: hypothetical protein FKN15_044666 [Acipenser sinensis]
MGDRHGVGTAEDSRAGANRVRAVDPGVGAAASGAQRGGAAAARAQRGGDAASGAQRGGAAAAGAQRGGAAAARAQRGGDAAARAQRGGDAAARAQRGGDAAARAQRGGDAAARAQRGGDAAARAGGGELPLPEPRGEELPLPEPRREELPLPEPRGEEPPLPEPREEVKSIPPPQPRPPPLRSSLAPLHPVPHSLLLDTLPVFLDLPVLDLGPKSLQHWPQLCPWFPAPLFPSTQTSLLLPLFAASLPLGDWTSLCRFPGEDLCPLLHPPVPRPALRSPLSNRWVPLSPVRGPYLAGPERGPIHPQVHLWRRAKKDIYGLEGGWLCFRGGGGRRMACVLKRQGGMCKTAGCVRQQGGG